TGSPTLEICAGTVGAVSTVLAIIPLSAPAFGASSTGTATLLGVPLSDTSANATGTAGVFLFKNNAGTEVWGGDISTTAAGTGAMTMPTTSTTLTEPVRIDSYTITTPA